MIKANAWACILVSCGLLLGLLRPTGVLAVELLLPIPEATKIDVDNLSLAVRASLACAGRYLMQNIETNNMGYLVPPIQQRTVKEYREKKEIDVRFRKESYWEVKTKPVYESYETMEAVSQGASVDSYRKIQKVTKQRVVRNEVVSSNLQERIVPDPNGQIVEKRIHYDDPVFTTVTIWPRNFVGINCMVLYALIKSGVVDEENDSIKKALRTLKGDLSFMGIPDTTWDLAWAAAAFSLIRDEEYFPLRDTLISKLCDGQIVEAPARGLWGPLCVRTDLLAAMIAHERGLIARWENAKEKLAESGKDRLKARPENKALLKTAEKAEQEVRAFQDMYKAVTMYGLRFEKIANTLKFDSAGDLTYIPGLPLPLYDQAVADLESTALALFALREAAANKALPENTWRPLTSTKQPVLIPETPGAILARAANAIALLQKADGTWDECNIHQSIAGFAPLGFPPLPKNQVKTLISSNRPICTLQGENALLCAGQIVGMNKLMNKFRSTVEKGREAEFKAAESYVNAPEAFAGAGRQGSPYDFFFQMASIHRLPGTLKEERRELWARMACRVVNLQKDDGGWALDNVPVFSSSALAILEVKASDAVEAKARNKPDGSAPQFNRAAWLASLMSTDNLMDGRALSTAYSMIFLMGGLREPVVGFLALGSGASNSNAVAMAEPCIQAFNRKRTNQATYLNVGLQTPAVFINRLPLLYLEPDLSGLDALAVEVITRYVEGNGFLVVGLRDGVTYDLAAKWAGWTGGGRAGNLPAGSALALAANGFAPGKAQGLYNAQGKWTGMLLKIGAMSPKQGGTELGLEQAMRLLVVAMNDVNTMPNREDNLTGKLLPATDDPFLVRIGAVNLLNQRIYDSRNSLAAAPVPAAANATAATANSASETNPPVVQAATADTPPPALALPAAVTVPIAPKADEQF